MLVLFIRRNFDQLKTSYLLWARGSQLFQITSMVLGITWIKQIKSIFLNLEAQLRLGGVSYQEIIKALSAMRPYIISDCVLE